MVSVLSSLVLPKKVHNQHESYKGEDGLDHFFLEGAGLAAIIFFICQHPWE